jgi:hypothetical protein
MLYTVVKFEEAEDSFALCEIGQLSHFVEWRFGGLNQFLMVALLPLLLGAVFELHFGKAFGQSSLTSDDPLDVSDCTSPNRIRVSIRFAQSTNRLRSRSHSHSPLALQEIFSNSISG